MRKIPRPPCPNKKALDNGNHRHADNKRVLIEASHGKCMYCESKVTHVDHGDIEHIKPKDAYPDLAFEWHNLGFSCRKCNNTKLNKYHDDTPYINPYDEEPSEHLISLGTFLKSKRGSERAEITIRDINLNRSELLEKRQARIDEIQAAINSCYKTKNESLREALLSELLKECDNDKEYSLFAQTLLKAHDLI